MRSLPGIGVLLFVSTSLLLSSCSTLFHRDPLANQVYIETSPIGATVLINGQESSQKTPAYYPLEGSHNTVQVTLKEYDTIAFATSRSAHWTFFLNIGLSTLGFLTAAVDYGTGAMWTISPQKQNFNLKKTEDMPIEEKAPPPPPETPVVKKLEIPQDKRMLDIVDRLPGPEMELQIRNYYGQKKPEEVEEIKTRLYLILYKSEDGLSLDQAIQRDVFEQKTKQKRVD